MWQSILQFLYEWLRRPSRIATIGMAGGILLFLAGTIWKVPRDKKLGLAVMGVCLIAGMLLYFYG